MIDELDRADADRALGGLSSFLGGLPVTLPGGEEVDAARGLADRRHRRRRRSTPRPRCVRRFAHVEVPVPATPTLDAADRRRRRRRRRPRRAPPGACSSCASCARSAPACSPTPPRHAAERNAIEPADERTLAREAYNAYVEPLLAGLDDREQVRLRELLGGL